MLFFHLAYPQTLAITDFLDESAQSAVASEDDADILEYYDTWNEEEFPDKYMGDASLSKCD